MRIPIKQRRISWNPSPAVFFFFSFFEAHLQRKLDRFTGCQMILLGHQFWIVDPLAGIGISVWMLNLGPWPFWCFFLGLDPSRRRGGIPKLGQIDIAVFFSRGDVNLSF